MDDMMWMYGGLPIEEIELEPTITDEITALAETLAVRDLSLAERARDMLETLEHDTRPKPHPLHGANKVLS